ncbi:MAG: phage tail tape measure protein [Barnesiella sp.]|nr:phage tail tape measure protein [Barnesiella sp.]
MANYTSTANVVLSVNGKQAQKMLSQLEKDARRLEKQIAKAATAGDKATMKKLQRELKSTQRMMEQLKGSSASVDQTLRRLDKASPKELNKALKLLQQQLNGIQRGTAAWEAHVAKIQRVKAELQKVNATLATQKSLWSRMNTWLNNAQTAIMAFAAAVTGLVIAGRKAVQSYADMEEQMANTIKYTRMTAAEVEELNEIFKGMDTRLAREQLNLLAQEGGRLGYNTVASVKEYVEAASIINVALVDLGEGATQTIAKLSNIFGMEQMYGVREAMLKIGSTVNHLSQNCTAAKPFIVEFAQRMAGIGSTAKMTIPEIMAFAATLDAHGQKVEMSATALQRTIMELFKKPAEMARKVGLETNSFIETLNKSTTQGVMMFLEALNKLGEDKALAVLSPLFQDLGLDGARVSSVLSNLSSHLDFLKWQLGEASEAFREGTSASNEYAIFNNTVQASIDKARKRVGELAIELGEKLYPLMKHIYTSSSAFMRVLNVIVDFLIKHRKAIGNLILVIGTYYSWLLLVKTATIAWNTVVGIGKAVMTAYRAALILGRIAVLAFTQGIGAATHAMRLLNAVVKANPFGLILSVIAAVVIAIRSLIDRTSEYTKKMREARNTAAALSEEYRKEMRNIDSLVGKLEAAKKGTKEYKNVKDEIIKQYGKYLKGLVNERGEITNLTEAYKRLAAAARIAAKERSIQTARENADEVHSEAFKTQAARLLESLQNEGKSFREATRITNQVVFQLETTGTLTADLVAELQAIKGNSWQANGMADHPVNIVNEMIEQQGEYNDTMAAIADIERENNALAKYTEQDLRRLIEDIEPKVNAGQGGRVVIGIDSPQPEVKNLNAAELRDFLAEAQARLSVIQTPNVDPVAGNPDFTLDDFTPYESDKDRKAREAEERRAAIKARKDFKEALNATKGTWESDTAQNVSDYSNGLKSWSDFLLRKHEIELKYFEDREAVYKQFNLTEDEDYQELLKKKADYEAAWLKKNAALKVEEAKRMQQVEETQAQMDFYTPGNALYGKEEALQQRLFEIKVKYLKKMQAAYNQASEEWHSYKVQIEQAESAEQLRRQKLLAQRVAEWKKQYEYREAKQRYDLEMELLADAFDKGLISYREFLEAQRDMKKKYADEYMPESAKPQSGSAEGNAKAMKHDLEIVKSLYEQGLISKKQYEQAKERIERTYNKKSLEGIRKFGSTQTNQLLDIYEAWQNFFNATEEDGGNWATRLAALASSVFAVMNAGMQQASEYMQACADIEVAKAEKKYDREIELAEGNSYRVKKAEKQKEKEIAKIKSDAAKKQFAMQVIQAVAQTATNALNAYGSAAQVPVIGYILAPIAAAMAVAAGAVQIATIKKQQQASEAQGYQSGGFTPEGKADEVAGVVHKGEWVASQRLVNNPRTRPLLEALDYAQRTNTIGSITAADVSRTITAPAVLAAQPQAPTVVNNTYNTAPSADNSELTSTIRELKDRLNEPFVTVNTVSGDHGIQQAQDEYDRLMRNKSPKSRK